ncbi:hypothetical protein ACIPSK_23750 [Rhizobium sp. LARHSG275]|nr:MULTISPECIES: hypothetical protein [Rhizobium]UWM74277.1 hypothetical protein N1937_16375 [Rhizobium leguminosarum bv. viciae]
MGTVTIEDGMIVVRRDYFDRQLGAIKGWGGAGADLDECVSPAQRGPPDD